MNDTFRIPLADGASTSAVVYPAADAATTLILGHGAGAGQHSPFMTSFARTIASLGVEVVTFNFLYMEQRRRAPDRAPALEACYGAVIRAVHDRIGRGRRLFAGGKSMGGRIATQTAAADSTLPLAGIVLLGYPLHPPGRPEQRRDAHLHAVGRPMLFVQGSRDSFGTPAELAPIIERLTPHATLHVVDGGDHSFKLAGKASQQAVYADIQRTIVEWIRTISRTSARAPHHSA